jgi:transketolase
MGGSADLAPSTMTLLEGEGSFSAQNRAGRNLHFGVREHAMAAAVNGMVLSGLRAYGATFFVFTDYLRPSLRLAALMRLPSLFILTHDSIGVGEDGPTHQPVEHLAALRAIPNLLTIRPADANEVVEAYRVALTQRQRPVALVLTRQNVPTLDRTRYAAASGLARGAYVLAETSAHPDLSLVATGSEVAVTVQAYEMLAAEGIKVRVVSMPCWELFEEQPEAYRRHVLPQAAACLAVEAGVKLGWDRYLGTHGAFVGMSGFGASAPAGTLMEHFGFTAERIAARARGLLAEHDRAP